MSGRTHQPETFALLPMGSPEQDQETSPSASAPVNDPHQDAAESPNRDDGNALAEPALKLTLAAWLKQTTNINEQELTKRIPSAELTQDALLKARAAAEKKVDKLVADRSAHNAFIKLLRSSTAYRDVRGAEAVRNTLKDVGFTWGEGDALENGNLLDVTRDSFEKLKQEINRLTEQDLGHQAEFLKQKMTTDIDRLIETIGRTAYDKTGNQRTKTIAALSASLILTTLPFAFAYYSVPTAWFYLSSLSAAYGRTSLQTVGLMRNPGTSDATAWDLTRERHLIWGIPSVLFGVPTFMGAAAGANPENTGLKAAAEAAIHNTEHGAYLGMAAAAEFALFAATNHPDGVKNAVRKAIGAGSSLAGVPAPQSVAFAAGTMAPKNPPQFEGVRDQFASATAFLKVISDLSNKLDSGGELSASEAAIFAEVDKDLGQLRKTMDLSLGQLGSQINDPTNRKEKKKIAMAYTAVGLALGAISCLAVIKFLPLLADYAPYYLATLLLMLVKGWDETTSTAELARIFGSYFGGTVLGLPFSLANLAFIFAKGAGAFDVVSENGYTSANATDAVAHPSPVHVHSTADFPAGNGLSFGIATSLQILLTLMFASKIGPLIAAGTLACWRQLAKTPKEIAAVTTVETMINTAVHSAPLPGEQPAQGKITEETDPEPESEAAGAEAEASAAGAEAGAAGVEAGAAGVEAGAAGAEDGVQVVRRQTGQR